MNHCPSCWTEFVAGVTACSDCGGPLTPGPLPERRPQPSASAPPVQSPGLAAVAAIDTFFAEMPGAKAEFIAEALKMEGITCRLECDGLVQHRGPEQRPAGAIAVTLPVSIYVAAADLEHARDIVASVDSEDLIGESWAEAEADEAEKSEVFDEPAAAPAVSAEGVPEGTEEVHAESSNTRLILLLVAAVVAILFMLRH